LCTGEDAIEITVNDYTGIEDAAFATNSIYPNPNNGIFNVTSSVGSTIQIIDISGRIIRTIDVTNADVLGVDLTEFGAGIYYAKFIGEEISITEKIIVNK
jgi:hypothetical protein